MMAYKKPPHQKPKRDSDIDVLNSAVSGFSNAEIYNNGYLSRGTIAKLRERRTGKKRTRYPSHMTMVGVAAACGMKWKLTKE
jgi:hypothetical protein